MLCISFSPLKQSFAAAAPLERRKEIIQHLLNSTRTEITGDHYHDIGACYYMNSLMAI